MRNNIIIFGKNSVLAKNFTKKYSRFNYIFVSHKSSDENEINFNIGKLLNQDEIKEICKEISKKTIYKDITCLLFSWAGGPRTNQNLERTWIINTNIIINFIEICKVINPSNIVFLSSAGSIYPQNNKDYSYKENDSVNPLTDYGYQKYLSEVFLSNYANHTKINLTILRISSAYGFDNRFSDQGVINKWIYSAVNNKSLKLYNSLESLINFISFDQISDAIKISIDKKLNGIFNIGSDRSISLSLILKIIQDTTKRNLDLEIINEKDRFFNLNTQKFFSKTEKIFYLSIEKDIKSIYQEIIS